MKFSELLDLFGKNIESPEVKEFFGKYPSFKVGRPSDGSQYAVSKQEGVDLLFEPDTGMQGGKTKHLRNCQAAFLYTLGKDGHKQYAGDLPLGFEFSDSRPELLSKATPELTWEIGNGAVPVTFENPDHDEWGLGHLKISAHYDSSSGAPKVTYFIVSKPKD